MYLADALNSGILPSEYIAMTEPVTGRPIPDVVALQTHAQKDDSGAIAVATAPLESTYLQAWAVFPAMLKELIEPNVPLPVMPATF